MSKFKIEKGVSRINRVKLQASIVSRSDMFAGLVRSLKLSSRMIVRHQIPLSAGLSVATGIILRALVVIP
jgi:hypothetical protein